MKNLVPDENFPLPAVSNSSVEVEAASHSGAVDPEEEHLIRECQGGNLASFDTLVKRYQDPVFGLAFQLLHDYDEAEDVAQEVFLSCFRNITSFRFESRFSTWLYRITVNRVKNRWKYLQRRKADKHLSLDAARDENDSRTIDVADPQADARQLAEGRQTLEILNNAMATLAEEYQQVLVLRFVEHLQYEEIAQVLACSLGTVKSRINRARAALREKMRGVLD